MNPKYTISNPTKTDAVFKGWSVSNSSTTVTNSSISNLELSANTTRYAIFTYNNKTLKSGTTYYSSGWNGQSHNVLTIDGTKYQSIAVTVQPYTLQCAAWAIACHALAVLKIMSGSSVYTSVDLRHTSTWAGWTPEGEEPE